MAAQGRARGLTRGGFSLRRRCCARCACTPKPRPWNRYSWARMLSAALCMNLWRAGSRPSLLLTVHVCLQVRLPACSRPADPSHTSRPRRPLSGRCGRLAAGQGGTVAAAARRERLAVGPRVGTWRGLLRRRGLLRWRRLTGWATLGRAGARVGAHCGGGGRGHWRSCEAEPGSA